VTTSSGAKFGKTEAGAVWLDPTLTSPYKFYQFWINVDDRDVESYLKLFTFLRRTDIETLLERHRKDPARREAQATLAGEVTKLVHRDATSGAVAASAILFGEVSPRDAASAAFDTLAQEIPTTTVAANVDLVDALIAAGLAKSKSEARRGIEQGGIYVNQERASAIGERDWIGGRHMLLRKGKKDYALLRRDG